MKWRPGNIGTSVAMALTLTFAAAVSSTVIVRAQEPAADSAKRKVKTRTVPEYPAIAKQMHITGKVKIEATIAPDGHVVSTHVVGGSPVLVGAATDALKKWRYESGPTETTEIVEFDFDGSGS
ncbi:MAG: energy transducer TonB [Candidatus Acidiferrales bacterium]